MGKEAFNTLLKHVNSQAVRGEGIELLALCVLYWTGLDTCWVDDLGSLGDRNETTPELFAFIVGLAVLGGFRISSSMKRGSKFFFAVKKKCAENVYVMWSFYSTAERCCQPKNVILKTRLLKVGLCTYETGLDWYCYFHALYNTF